jgi:hypothetical protein
MINYRILLSFITFSAVFSIGLGQPVDADTAIIEKAKAAESVVVEKTYRRPETGPENTKNKQTSVNVKEVAADKSNASESSEFQQTLDLSVPYKDPENAETKTKQNISVQNSEANIFTPETIKKSRPLQLNGGFLMSPEPEAEKRKSVDGAGIVINIKP